MTGKQHTETWWTPQQLKLVEDSSRSWHRATFEPSDMLLFHREGGLGAIGRPLVAGEQPGANSEVVKGGWDHAHCELCWEKISAHGENQHEGYTDGKAWVCTSCFDKYVAPRL